MERMKKVLSSPITKKRNIMFGQYFGVPLEELVTKECTVVPHLVTQVCNHIKKMGFNYEGIFRVSGNARIQEKLRASFDRSGDADFDEVNDIMAVAGLLKMFIRELPEAVIPEKLTTLFVNTQQAYALNNTECLRQFKDILKQLPNANYNTLKVLIEFLVQVAQHEDTNKMSPRALAIVFGPNLFRWSAGLAGLKQQGTINQVTFHFISFYNDLFNENIRSTSQSIAKGSNAYVIKDRPNRPPPPKIPDELSASKKNENYNNNGERMNPEIDESSNTPQSLSEDEYMDSHRSFNLDSENSNLGNSTVRTECPSPVSNVISELIERTISTVVSERLFGEDSRSNSSDDTPKMVECFGKTEEPVPAPRRTKFCYKLNENENPSSFGEQVDLKPLPITSYQDSLNLEDCEMNFDDIPSNDSLKIIKRPSGPKNRRTPSRISLEKIPNPDEMINSNENDVCSINPLIKPYSSKSPAKWSTQSKEEDKAYIEDINHNNISNSSVKPSTDFLNKFHNGSKSMDITPDHSPTESRKPYIPPLDLSILHSNIDGEDPIPTVKGQSMGTMDSQKYKNDPISSPRMSRHKPNKNRTNDESPPSPDSFRHSFTLGIIQKEEDITSTMKSLTKKIQACKKKIKVFEEYFETEHGFKPSLSDKVARPEIKVVLQELSNTRKDFRRFKEEIQFNGDNGKSCVSPGSMEDMDLADDESLYIPTIEETYFLLESRLREKRKEVLRPKDIKIMNVDQLCDEKLAVQKALLQYESLHGRPTAKLEKEIMKPLYDRYRAIKKLLPCLQPVPEDHTIEFSNGIQDQTSKDSLLNTEHDTSGNSPLDFIITQNVSLLFKDTFQNSPNSDDLLVSPDAPGPPKSWRSNLHKLSKPQLYEELKKANIEKKRLRKVLRQFETEFNQQNGRRVEKVDRQPMESEYLEYKQVKAKLKLLDALASKEGH